MSDTSTDTNVDIFAGITDPAPADTVTAADATDAVSDTASETSASAEDSQSETPDPPVVTVAEVPTGAMSVTEFAAHMTQVFMRAKILAGEDLDQNDYVVPQSVYQTVKAQRDRIPHILVQGPDDAEPRVHILKDEATEWFTNRKDRLSTRGTGAQRASSRTAEDNLSLLNAAVYKDLYTQSRLDLWTGRKEQTTKLIEKYQGFLKDQSVDADTVSLTIQEATDRFNTDMAAKAAEKEAKAKKSGKTETDTSDDDNE
jgi:hypothetical protein